jgi:hypothetical protein
MTADQLLSVLRPSERTMPASVNLPISYVQFLDAIASARGSSRSATLRDLLAPIKSQWESMSTDEQRSIVKEAAR